MDLSLRNKLIAGLVGAGAIGAIGFIGAVAVPAVVQAATETAPSVTRVISAAVPSPGRALSVTLQKFDGDYYAIGTEPSVSLTPQSTTTVRKIAYGRTTFVNIVTTASRVYSTDGLTSPNVRYPGIYTEPMHLRWSRWAGLYGWSRLTGWTQIPLFAANSFGYLDTSEVPHSQNGVCVADTDLGGCR